MRDLSLIRILLFFCVFFSVFIGLPSDELPYNEDFESTEVELLISYKLITKDNVATKESYRVSRVMNAKAHKGFEVIKECAINAGDYRIMDDMPYFIAGILKAQKDQVLECLYHNEVRITESTRGRDNALTSRANLEISPTRVKARLEAQNIILQILKPTNIY